MHPFSSPWKHQKTKRKRKTKLEKLTNQINYLASSFPLYKQKQDTEGKKNSQEIQEQNTKMPMNNAIDFVILFL